MSIRGTSWKIYAQKSDLTVAKLGVKNRFKKRLQQRTMIFVQQICHKLKKFNAK